MLRPSAITNSKSCDGPWRWSTRSARSTSILPRRRRRCITIIARPLAGESCAIWDFSTPEIEADRLANVIVIFADEGYKTLVWWRVKAFGTGGTTVVSSEQMAIARPLQSDAFGGLEKSIQRMLRS